MKTPISKTHIAFCELRAKGEGIEKSYRIAFNKDEKIAVIKGAYDLENNYKEYIETLREAFNKGILKGLEQAGQDLSTAMNDYRIRIAKKICEHIENGGFSFIDEEGKKRTKTHNGKDLSEMTKSFAVLYSAAISQTQITNNNNVSTSVTMPKPLFAERLSDTTEEE